MGKPEPQSLRNARASNQAELTRINNGIAAASGRKLNRAERRAAAKARKAK